MKMNTTYSGKLVATGLKFGIVVARWNDFMSTKLLEGAQDCLLRHGVAESDIDVAKVPGSFELPLAVKKMAATGRYDAIVCLGVIIRGATPHFDFIAAETTKGIAQVSLDKDIPVSFGVITTDSMEQAIERAGSKAGNKGVEAALAAIEMVNVIQEIETGKTGSK